MPRTGLGLHRSQPKGRLNHLGNQCCWWALKCHYKPGKLLEGRSIRLPLTIQGASLPMTWWQLGSSYTVQTSNLAPGPGMCLAEQTKIKECLCPQLLAHLETKLQPARWGLWNRLAVIHALLIPAQHKATVLTGSSP